MLNQNGCFNPEEIISDSRVTFTTINFCVDSFLPQKEGSKGSMALHFSKLMVNDYLCSVIYENTDILKIFDLVRDIQENPDNVRYTNRYVATDDGHIVQLGQLRLLLNDDELSQLVYIFNRVRPMYLHALRNIEQYQ